MKQCKRIVHPLAATQSKRFFLAKNFLQSRQYENPKECQSFFPLLSYLPFCTLLLSSITWSDFQAFRNHKIKASSSFGAKLKKKNFINTVFINPVNTKSVI